MSKKKGRNGDYKETTVRLACPNCEKSAYRIETRYAGFLVGVRLRPAKGFVLLLNLEVGCRECGGTCARKDGETDAGA